MSSRRKFLGQLSLVAAAATLPKFASSSVLAGDDFVIAGASEGKLRGIRKNGVCLFKGVPYAGRLSGDRRFKRLQNWSHGKASGMHWSFGRPPFRAILSILPQGRTACFLTSGHRLLTTKGGRSCFITMVAPLPTAQARRPARMVQTWQNSLM